MADFRKDGRPCPIAHRGCMEAGPENSLTAFEEAAALGAGGVEMDVRRTRDGKLVVFHDADVRRLCMEAGPENSLTAFEEAAALGAGGVEMDVRRTRDGKLVVFHDADVRRLTMGWQGPYNSGKVKDMTWEKLSQVRLPFGGHLLKRFPEGGYSNERQYYYPWAVAPEQEVLYQMERFESRAENEEQVLSAVYRRYKEEYERRCLEDGRLERILSLREFFQWLRTQPEGFFAEVELKERGIAYKEEYERRCLEDGRLERILSLREFFQWLRTQPEGFFAEVELKERGIAGAVIQMAEKCHAADRCIVFSGMDEVVWEIQDWCRSHKKPEGLRMGANIRFLKDEQKEMLDRGDFYEVGLNAGSFGREEVEYLHQKGIQVFSNLGDTPDWWESLDRLGVDGFKTNCLGQYRKWRQKWERK